MAFVYEEAVDNPFWMGNVAVPLSIVWSRDGTAVGIAEMRPYRRRFDLHPLFPGGTLRPRGGDHRWGLHRCRYRGW